MGRKRKWGEQKEQKQSKRSRKAQTPQTNAPREASVQGTPSMKENPRAVELRQKQPTQILSAKKMSCKKLPDPKATTEIRDNAQIRHEMTSTLTPGTWVIFKSDGDPEQSFWLGKTLPRHEWGNECLYLNTTDRDEDVEGAKIVAGTYAINVQWYAPKVVSVPPEYVVEGGDNAMPFVQSNYNLLCTGFENGMHQVEGEKVRDPRQRTVRSYQRDDFEYSIPRLQTTEGEWHKRESENVWKMDEAVRDKAIESLRHWHSIYKQLESTCKAVEALLGIGSECQQLQLIAQL